MEPLYSAAFEVDSSAATPAMLRMPQSYSTAPSLPSKRRATPFSFDFQHKRARNHHLEYANKRSPSASPLFGQSLGSTSTDNLAPLTAKKIVNVALLEAHRKQTESVHFQAIAQIPPAHNQSHATRLCWWKGSSYQRQPGPGTCAVCCQCLEQISTAKSVHNNRPSTCRRVGTLDYLFPVVHPKRVGARTVCQAQAQPMSIMEQSTKNSCSFCSKAVCLNCSHLCELCQHEYCTFCVTSDYAQGMNHVCLDCRKECENRMQID